MSKSYHRTVCFLSVILALSACESDASKMQRLRTNQTYAELDVSHWQYFVNSYPPERLPQYALDSLAIARNRLDLANRELNRFMH